MVKHLESSFNKRYTICKLIENEHIFLKKRKFNKIRKGHKSKWAMTDEEHFEILIEIFDIIPRKSCKIIKKETSLF